MPDNWNYYNGTDHGWNAPDGYHPPKPLTRAYCWDCGPGCIPGFGQSDPRMNGTDAPGHWGTDFKCAPWRIGRPCDNCGKDI